MLQCKKYVANRQGTIFKSLVVTLKLQKAVGSGKKNLATQMSSKALLKLASSNDTSI